MIRRPPSATQSRSSAASDVYKRQAYLYDSTDGRRLYKNGDLVFDDSESGTPQASTDPLTIGNEQPMSRFVDGIMDDVRIYSRVLTLDELADVMLGKGPNAELADDPSPANEATDVPRDTVLALSLIHISEPTRPY